MAADERHEPMVIQFAFTNYSSDGAKHKAICKTCFSPISDKLDTTSGFTR